MPKRPLYSAASKVKSVRGVLSKDGDAPRDVVASINQRFRAPPLLCLGATAALCAFVGTFLVTFLQFFRVTGSELLDLHPYPSGFGYWPETVSESVNLRNSPAGKIFFTGCLVAAVAFLLSWYPMALRNVYTGPELTCFGYLYSTTFRQFMPPLGLLMLIGVSTYPQSIAKATAGAQVCVLLHLTGAGMMFVGYMFSEYKCLELCGFRHHNAEEYGHKFLSIEGVERHLRNGTIQCMGFCFGIFVLCQGLLSLPASAAPCCADTWILAGEWINRTSPNGVVFPVQMQIAHVNNTASGGMLGIKMASYFSEVLAGLFLIASHFIVYYFCEERHVEYGMSVLEMVYDDQDEEDPDGDDM